MKTMKKVLTLLLGVAMIISFAGAVSAMDVSGDLADEKENGNEVKVTYTQTGLYEVTLPESITLKKGEGVSEEVSVTSLDIPTDMYLLISVSSKNGWKISDTTYEYDYKMSYFSGPATAGEYFGGDSTEAEADQDIYLICTTKDTYEYTHGESYADWTIGTSVLFFEMEDNPDFGTYEDTLTFTISVSEEGNKVNYIDDADSNAPGWYTNLQS